MGITYRHVRPSKVLQVGGLGTISDLAATGVTATTVTLTWSDVAGGTSYQPQYRTTAGGGSYTDFGSAIGSGVETVTVTGLTEDVQYDFRVIASDGSTTTTSNVVQGTPTAASNNEPAGYTQITDQPFNSVTADSWYADGTTGTIISSASDAPESPPNAMRATYPAGHASGGAPIDVERSISASGYSEIYLRIVTRHDASWQGEASGTNKVVFLWVHGDPAFFLSAEGVDAGTLTPTMRLQNVPDARGSLSNNIASASITRGSWHTWEVQLIANTAGSANGVARLWFDGTLIAEHTDVEWDTAGGDTWQFIEINPTWGGNTPAETVDSEMYLDYDHCYASGA